MTDEEIAAAQREIQARARYLAASHAMQSGVAAKLPLEPAETTPKHLRVGVNAAMVETGALAKLLLAKGVFSEAEYLETLADQMEAEARLYEQWLSDRTGAKVRLR